MSKVELPVPSRVIRDGVRVREIIFDVVDQEVPKTVIFRPKGRNLEHDTYVADQVLFNGMMRRSGGIIASARRAEMKRAATGQQLALPLAGGGAR